MKHAASLVWIVGWVLWAGVDSSPVVEKRSVILSRPADEFPGYQTGVRYDEYPIIVPSKRAAILIDRLMVALKKAIEEEEAAAAAASVTAAGRKATEGSPRTKNFSVNPEDAMDLQRRGQQKGRVYWRCYFNAVTCF